MSKKQKLELTWIGKEHRPKLEPRILIENPEKSYHAKHRFSEHDIFDNMLIHGDNLLALKALEHDFTGKVKCVFIDPPYNTGSAFTHYDDGLEHSTWLSLIRDRLEIIRRLIADDGSLWITIDDIEVHYLKVLCDEVFARQNFVANVIWQKRFSPNSTAQYISDSHDHILVYAKEKTKWKRKLLPRDEKHNKNYKNSDNDPRGPWTSGDLSARNSYSAGIYPITTPSGRLISGPPKGMYWRVSFESFQKLDKDNRIWWGEKKNNVPRLKRFLSEVMDGIVPQTIWLQDDVGHTQEAKKEVIAVVPNEAEVFQTPKPERLLNRVLNLATNPGDIVLDSFLGSGTTAAVAHKMGRRWIGIELGDHCYTHCIPRLKKVIDGEDLGGITMTHKTAEVVKLCKACKEALCEDCSEKVGESNKGGEQKWFGGGGFRFYKLGPSLVTEDEWGNPVINSEFNPAMLAEAMCKLEGFTYAPSEEHYWVHGHSTETDFIYVTTQFMSKAMLDKLSDDVGPERSLMICCSAFKADVTQFPNLTINKIPKAVLKKCEWGRDDYSLAVANLPAAPQLPIAEPDSPLKEKREKKKDKQPLLPGFDV